MRLRIVCKVEHEERGVVALARRYADISDVRVVALEDDGTEHEVSGVTGITWSVRMGESSKASITIEGAEIDVPAEVMRGR